MKIVSFKSRLVRLPAEEPLAGGTVPPGLTRDFVTLVVRTDDGIEGIGYTFMGWAIAGALKTAVDELAALVVGDDPLAIEAIHEKLRAAAGTAGPGGIFTLAVAAIDIALWDIKGKALGLPVATLAGGFRKQAPVYASGALGRGRHARSRRPRRRAPGRERLPADEDESRAAGRDHGRHGDRARTGDPQGDRPRHRADGRRQPALGRAPGAVDREPRSRSSASTGSRTRSRTTTTRGSPRWRRGLRRRSRPASMSTAAFRSATCWRRVRSISSWST